MLNIWTPTYCDRQYVLNLGLPDQRKLCQHLIALGKEESGAKHLFEQSYYMNENDEHAEGSSSSTGASAGSGEDEEGESGNRYYSFQDDSTFMKYDAKSGSSCLPPDHGIFSFRYGVSYFWGVYFVYFKLN